MLTGMDAFCHHYIYRPAEYIAGYYRADLMPPVSLVALIIVSVIVFPTVIISAVVSAVAITSGVGQMIAMLVATGIAIVVSALLILLFAIAEPVSENLGDRYDPEHVTNYRRKLTKEVSDILQHYGPLPKSGLLYLYHKTYKRKLDHTRLNNLLKFGNQFAPDGDGHIKLTVGDPTVNYLPTPIDGDYVAGYYQMYEMMLAVKEHSELADTPLTLIASLYSNDGIVIPPTIHK
jgi:hypothetical protein